ncbi:flagellar basal-body rod protein FlgF [Halanaerobacter jeridensis]|uniref:Flagellar hook protein FlgE n=1 Tax=Halanaerobacter jeridensis TaxID=706427 RepID=A0A938XU86_9FIRM|nr:flagellar basal-body rod protein FlgF [Halanaerobacter jeridensis]MBM7555345.1 flagellar hook protein FlgE [Halanaerobacter jeridensis]
MLRSMYAGVSGMKAHMDKMDVVSNNISNVNTVGYKGSRATFKTMFSQMIQGASAPQGGRGGTNPQQIGLGTSLGSIDKDMGQGSLQSTGRNQDLAIEGEGFFVVSNGISQRYTRSGTLSKDENGYLVNSTTGYRVRGWQADANGDINTNGELEGLTLKQNMPAESTTEVTYGGNLDAAAANGEQWNTSFESYDSQGGLHKVDLRFTKNAANTWDYEVTHIEDKQGDVEYDISGTHAADTNNTTGTVAFNGDGSYDAANSNIPGNLEFNPQYEDDGAATPVSIDLDFSNMTQNYKEMTADRDTVNGYKAGSLVDYTFDSTGTITGEYDNGMRQTIGQVALASFNNPGGLASEGQTMFRVSNNSGAPKIGAPASGGLGNIKSGSLEMSNVDLSRQFTEMITTQRGFQANSKTISTSDQILQELVNLKR